MIEYKGIYKSNFDYSKRSIQYIETSGGRIAALIPIKSTSYNEDNSFISFDGEGSSWCKCHGMYKYKGDNDIYILKLSFGKYEIYDSFQDKSRNTNITVTFATANENMVFNLKFNIKQVGCESSKKPEGDIVFWKTTEDSGTYYFTKENVWSGADMSNNIIKSSNIEESKMMVKLSNSLRGAYSNQGNLTKFETEDCDFSSVISFSKMFCGCGLLESVDISGFDFSSALDISGMFSGCKLLKSVVFPDNCLSSCTDMSNLFYGCETISNIDLTGVDSSSVTKINGMFYGCSSLSVVDLSGIDVSNCLYMHNLFYGCSTLESIDITSWDVSKCENFSNMFFACSSLTSIVGDNNEICGISVLNGAKKSIDISQTKLNPASIVAIFFGVDSVDENSGVKFKMTEEQKKSVYQYLSIIEAKNWEIVI